MMAAKTLRPQRIKLPDGQSFFAIFELARIFGVHRARIIDLIDTDELKDAVDIRGKGSCRSTIRIPRVAVIEFLESRKQIRPQGTKRAFRVINRRVRTTMTRV